MKDPAARDAWAAARGLRLSTCVPYCVCVLQLQRPRYCSRSMGAGHQFPIADHPELWLRGGRPARVVFHPYGHRGLDALRAVAAQHGHVVLHDLAATRLSWYFPGSTDRVQVLRDPAELAVDTALGPEPHPPVNRLHDLDRAAPQVVGAPHAEALREQRHEPCPACGHPIRWILSDSFVWHLGRMGHASACSWVADAVRRSAERGR